MSDGHRVAQFLDRVGFELANTLGGHAVLRGELVQRHLVLGQPARLDDVAGAIVKDVHRGGHARRRIVIEVRGFDLRRRVGLG